MKDKREEYGVKMQQLSDYCGAINNCLVCEYSSACSILSLATEKCPEYWDSEDIRVAVNILLLEDQKREVRNNDKK